MLTDTFLEQSKERKPEQYVTPVVQWLTGEWKIYKRTLFNRITVRASQLPEEYGFTSNQQSAILNMMDDLVRGIKDGLRNQIRDARRLARRDARIQLNVADGETSMLLSQEGYEQVIEDLDAQMEYLDDVNAGLKPRIRRLVDARYTDKDAIAYQVGHLLRINRENLIENAKNRYDDLADRFNAGRITAQSFKNKMVAEIRKDYRKAYRSGKRTPLNDSDRAFIAAQVETQREHLDNLAQSVEDRRAAGEPPNRTVNQRSKLFAERISAVYEAGGISMLTEDVLIDWVLGIAEHCRTCPIYARNSPYLAETLPGLPGEGFNITQCGTNCKCHLEINELSIAEMEAFA